MRIIQSPGKYIQGPGVLASLSSYVKTLASNWLVLVDKQVTHLTEQLTKQNNSDINFNIVPFNGQCSDKEIERLNQEVTSRGCNGIMAIGGGKALDTAKAVAFYQHMPSVMVPTAASTDAPTSALSVIYTEEGGFKEYLFYPNNPNMVIVDSAIVAKAPVRLLVCGMGDALSTWFEAEACFKSRATTMAGGQTTRAALSLARLCYDTLLQEGLKAKTAVEQGLTSPSVEHIIEANTYLSGIGFESSGLAAAHAIHNGLTQLEDCHAFFHGEKVVYGTLTQLILQNSSMEQINEVQDFCMSVGLPITLGELNIKQNITEKMRIVAEKSCAPGETIHNMPCTINPETVYSALLVTDALGKKKLALSK